MLQVTIRIDISVHMYKLLLTFTISVHMKRPLLLERNGKLISFLIVCYHLLSFVHCPHLQLSSTGCSVK